MSFSICSRERTRAAAITRDTLEEQEFLMFLFLPLPLRCRVKKESSVNVPIENPPFFSLRDRRKGSLEREREVES